MINYTIDQNVAVITWAMTSAPMNVLNDESIPQFETALQRAFADESVKGVIITSAKPEFVAGADLKMILRNNDKDPADMLKVSSELNRIFRSIETSGKPTVAAMNGTALGGGYEICLACHHRIALNNPKTLIGLVEVTIGLLPGGGGTQRLPRMIGIQTALSLMLEGKKVSVQEAKNLGMIDDIADSPADMMAKARAWIDANLKPIKPWDEVDRKTGKIIAKDNFIVPGGNVQSAIGARTFSAGTAMLMEKTKGNYPAPLAIMACVYEGLQVNIDRALVIEGRHFVNVATSKVAKNLIQTMFLGLNEANKGINRPKDIPKIEVKKLGILGDGLMAEEIVQVSVQAGIDVVLNDSTDEMADWQNYDLIIEPMLASDASTSLSTRLAQVSAKPENFIGIHFFSPVDKMMLVEIIMAKQTSDYALAVAMDYVRKIRKTPIVVNDSPGFYTSRCFGTYSAEGIELLKESVNPILIENAGKAIGMPVGPLTGTVAQDVYKIAQQQPTLNEVKTRLLYRQAIEAVRCLEENVVRTKLDADLGSILGWGFPAYTGGALSFVDFVGVDTFVSTCDRLADTYGERFRPTELLRERVKALTDASFSKQVN